ncbi:fungal specific transcription factor domain-containing protein [Aspergillus puulaauensis]|uniref:Xylanolytic transcriptional activator regulatory domain-containing protein n=1 Tax=Aspergillus puulaauensis TaxID=1220207 RepID=A0A7R8AKQ4_9EURO|nr:uncharacterized protein APUU_30107S [Aspergillus puulaauensis]BCS21882.1 hypothetical protein APUU_30107S [Aspergillus puulaauensis]
MLAAAAFIHSPDKCYPGCLSHRELRRTFFQKSKMIYESNLGAEADTITQIQSLLLMSSWQDEGDYAKDSHYWLSLAISTAQRLGLHQRSSAPHSPLHRRLWWCIYLQDIRISLALRRPRQIKDEDSTVEPLTEEDLCCCFVSDRVFPALASLQSMLDSRNQHAIIRQFLLAVQLGLQAGKVLDDFYHASWTQTIDPQLPLLLQPNTSITLTMGVSTEGSLDSAARVPGANSFELREELTAINSEDDLRRVSLAVQRMDYYLLHRSALCYLFRSLDFSPQTSCSVWNVRLSDAARDITSIVELFRHRLDVILVPGIAVTALSLAKEVHAMELKSARGNNKMHPLSMFRLCERTLKSLYETYPAAISQSGLP